MTVVLGKPLQLFRNVFSHDTPFVVSLPATVYEPEHSPVVISEVDLHLLYYICFCLHVHSQCKWYVCVCGGGGGGGGVHVCTRRVSVCVCRVYVCSECVNALRSCCVFLV